MKGRTKLAAAVLIAASLIASTLLAEAPLVKRHDGLTGKGGAAVDCKYCHVTAGNPKDGKDYDKYKKGPFCAIKTCH